MEYKEWLLNEFEEMVKRAKSIVDAFEYGKINNLGDGPTLNQEDAALAYIFAVTRLNGIKKDLEECRDILKDV